MTRLYKIDRGSGNEIKNIKSLTLFSDSEINQHSFSLSDRGFCSNAVSYSPRCSLQILFGGVGGGGAGYCF